MNIDLVVFVVRGLVIICLAIMATNRFVISYRTHNPNWDVSGALLASTAAILMFI